jgi:hypothetical protein
VTTQELTGTGIGTPSSKIMFRGSPANRTRNILLSKKHR